MVLSQCSLEMSVLSFYFCVQTGTVQASGQKKKVYESAYQTVENMLGLRSRLGIHELAVQCGCSEVRELAQCILTK